MLTEAALGLPILAQSASDLVVVKPAGMATELTRDPRKEALISRVRAALGPDAHPRLVHRLDRVTRGIVMVTLSKEAAAFYSEQIREGLWEKYYLARIPRPDPRTNPLHQQLIGQHKAFIKEEDTRAKLVRAGGKPSFLGILAIEPCPERPSECHALIRLLTGRLHQIRVMLAGLGLPLVGDDWYGGRAGPMYLEHAALWYIDYTTREITLAHRANDPEREPLNPAMQRALARITRGAK